MLKKLKQLLTQPEQPSNTSDTGLKLAAATLMFELVRSDGNIDEVELEQMQKILKIQFELTANEVSTLIDEAQNSAEQAISLQGFTRQICENWSNEERVKLLEYLWVLALADNHVDAHERHLVRKIAGLLYLTDRQINVARENAKHQLSKKP